MRKLGRKNKHRHQTLKNLAMSILIYEKVTTTQAKAKEVRSLVEKSINIAKKNDLNARRRLLSLFLHNKNVVKKLTEDIGKRFKDVNSGYTKIYKTNSRLGDNASMAIIILSKSKFLNNLKTEKEENKEEKKVLVKEKTK